MRTLALLALISGGALVAGCRSDTLTAKYVGVDTLALAQRYSAEHGSSGHVSRFSHLSVGGAIQGVIGLELWDSVGFEFVLVAVDSAGTDHVLHRTGWEEGGCGLPEHRLGDARLLRLGGRDLLLVEHRILRDGCIESIASEESTIRVFDVTRSYRGLLTFAGTAVHFGDPSNEGRGARPRWPARLGGVVITYAGNVCRASCEELVVWRYGDPEPARMSMVAYGWNVDSTELVVTRGSEISQ